MSRRLRVAHVVVVPVLVFDDGAELTPGPPVDPLQVPLSALAGLADAIAADVERASLAEPSTGGPAHPSA